MIKSISFEDITLRKDDAIVNSAHPSLLAGSGVSGAIHKAAGRQLEEACRKIGQQPYGSSVFTEGFKLPATYVIHAVTPKWHLQQENESWELLRETYRSIFRCARELEIKTLSIPSLGTGINGFPLKEASHIALEEANVFIQGNENLEIYFIEPMQNTAL